MAAAEFWTLFGIEGLVAVVFFLLLRSYLNEKGKNLAAKEDIADMTRRIEEVKTEHAVLLEETRYRISLRNAILAERFKAHQEAYGLWRKLLERIHRPELADVVHESYEWWDANCLYLDEPARSTFFGAIRAAATHSRILNGPRELRASLADAVTQNFATITQAGDTIAKTVALPGLAPGEATGQRELGGKGGPTDS